MTSFPFAKFPHPRCYYRNGSNFQEVRWSVCRGMSTDGHTSSTPSRTSWKPWTSGRWWN